MNPAERRDVPAARLTDDTVPLPLSSPLSHKRGKFSMATPYSNFKEIVEQKGDPMEATFREKNQHSCDTPDVMVMPTPATKTKDH